ncbi:MAG: hypothetical protein AAGC55_24120, partial [Myxococcota bacterium]
GLMNSPGHRANLLSDAVTHIGIGIAFGRIVANRRELFVTQVFTRVPPVIGVNEAKRRVNAEIKRRGGVQGDSALTTLADELATNLASGMAPAAASRKTSTKLDALARRFIRVTSAVSTVADIAAFDADSVLSDKRITHYGVGVGQGNHPEMGENALFIVVLLGQAR